MLGEKYINWILFPAGPQLLEAMNAGAIDLGHTGEAPPIFAQAANNPFVYIGNQRPDPSSEAILVAQNSPIKTRSRSQRKEGRSEQRIKCSLSLGQDTFQPGGGWKRFAR
jgi:ABC-type nitrate/sulfonate/bicarbonate transport system substrate-binding protein